MSLMKCLTKKPGSQSDRTILAKLIDGPATSRPLADQANDPRRIQFRLFRVQQSLNRADHSGRDKNLIGHFDALAGTGRTKQFDLVPHDPKQRESLVESFLVTAAHDRQSPVLGPDVSTTHGSVQEITFRRLFLKFFPQDDWTSSCRSESNWVGILQAPPFLGNKLPPRHEDSQAW